MNDPQDYAKWYTAYKLVADAQPDHVRHTMLSTTHRDVRVRIAIIDAARGRLQMGNVHPPEELVRLVQVKFVELRLGGAGG